MRRALRYGDSIGLTEEEQELLAALWVLSGDITAPAAKLPAWSPPVQRVLRNFIRDSGVVPALEAQLRSHPGRKSVICIELLVLSWLMANWESRSFLRTALVVAASRLPDDIAIGLGMVDEHGDRTMWNYGTFAKQQLRVERAMRAELVSQDWLETSMMDASVPDHVADNAEAIALDTTAAQGWAVPVRFERQEDVNKIVRAYYLESIDTTAEPVDLDMSSPHMRAAAAELGYPLGEDGLLERSHADFDMRGHHKTATNKSNATKYSGYEYSAAVMTRTIDYDPRTGAVTLGPPVPRYSLAGHTSKAGTDPGQLGALLMRRSRGRANRVRDVNADGAFTSKTDTFSIPALQEGFRVHKGYPQPHVHGGGRRTEIKSGGKSHIVIWHCGRPFHEYAPKYYLTPPPEMFIADEKPCEGETPQERQAREKRNKARAAVRADWLEGRFRWMYDMYERLPDGRRRWMCPFHAGKLYNRALAGLPTPRSSAKFGILPKGVTTCCPGTFTMSHEDLAPYQEIDFFTPEHALARGQRNAIEGNFGTTKNQGGFDPIKCQALLLQPRAIASLVAEVVKNLQITMNLQIADLYQKVEAHHQLAGHEQQERPAKPEQQQLAKPEQQEPAEPERQEPAEFEQPPVEPKRQRPPQSERRSALRTSTLAADPPLRAKEERSTSSEHDDRSPKRPRPPPSMP